MFGNKDKKRERLAKLVEAVASEPGITQAKLARVLGVHRATVWKDLGNLSEMGVRLAEDDRGGLYLGN